jgi:Ribbon-helix-helix domain
VLLRCLRSGQFVVDYAGYDSYHSYMGKTKLKQDAVYLMPDKHELLLELCKKSRISRSELLREAVDDLLKKHGMLKGARRKL